MKDLIAEALRKNIPLELLVPDPKQPRQENSPAYSDASIAELAKNMLQQSQLVDVIAFEETTIDAAIDMRPKTSGRFIVVDGHRRRLAAQRNNWTSLRCTILPRRPEPRELLSLQFSINEQRESLKPLELLAFFQSFMAEFGMKQSELAEWFGISKSTISNILKLQESTDEERALISSGRLGVSAAAALCRMDPDTRKDAVAEVHNGNVTRDELHGRSKRRSQTSGKPRDSSVKRFTFELPSAKASFAAGSGFSIDHLLKLLEELARICKKARAEGLDITTLERVVRDRMKAALAEAGGQHVSLP